jgi:elongation factor Ts
MEITTEMIKELRAATGAGILDCRKALTEANGDYQKAVDWLREKGMATAAKRADREASQGIVELYSHGGGRVGVMVEVNCETDFVARSDKFRELAHEIALQIAASAPRYLKAEEIPADVLEHEAEIARARAKEEGKPENMIAKIVEGQINKFQKDVVLIKQPFVMNPDVTIEQLVADTGKELGAPGLHLAGFVRLALGEGVEKVEGPDFATEVAQMTGGQ